MAMGKSRDYRFLLRAEPRALVVLRFLLFVAVVWIVISELPEWAPASQALEIPKSATQRLDYWLEQLNNIFLPLLAIGIVTSAIVEAFKSSVQPRAFYHKVQLLRWLSGHFCDSPQSVVQSEYRHLIDLCAAGDEWSLLRLPTETFVVEVNAGIQIALDNPIESRNCSLVRRVACTAASVDLETVFGSAEAQATADEIREARQRITALVQRRLSGLEMRIRSSWSSYLHFLALLVSAGIIYWAYHGVYSGRTLIVFSLVGAIIAPIVRDLVAAISEVRTKLS